MHEHPLSQKNIPPEEILRDLIAVYQQTLTAFSNQEFTLAETTLLAETVVQVRNMLADWADAESSQGKNKELIEAINNMKKCYLALEGLVKERRNDLIIK